MSIEQNQQPLRLRKKHGSGAAKNISAADGRQLLRGQSIRNSITVALIAIIAFSFFSIALANLTDRVFPWLVVVLGFLIGNAVRIAGRGTDWRFPLIAAVLAVLGSLFTNVAVRASVRAEDLGIGTLEVLSSVTTMTWSAFFNEQLNGVDVLFALMGAALAAFYAPRRLTRSQYHSLRLWREKQEQENV